MDNFNEPKNIMGMADILVDDDEDLDIEDIERSITRGISISKKEEPIDLAEEYDAELKQLSKQFNIDTYGKEPSMDNGDENNLIDWSPENYNKPTSSYISTHTTAHTTAHTPSYSIDTSNDADDSEEHINISSESSQNRTPWSSDAPRDRQLSYMTNEERKQTHINRVLGNLDSVDEDTKFIQEEEEEDEMARIFEQIDLLKSNLEAEGVDLSRIPDVNTSTTKKEARNILKILNIKNDRLRYCSMFEEGILAVAYGLEAVFDGKREILGSKIDLVGWPESVKVKLRRMRYDTSSFVSDVMKGYNIGHGWRIVFELLPSLFLYSRDRRLRTNDNLISDSAYKNALNDLQN